MRIRQGDGTRVQNFMETGGIELVQHLLPLAGGNPELIPRPPRVSPAVRPRDRAARRAARPKESLRRLETIADKADAATSASELFELDFEFYVVMAGLSGNQVMLLLINTVREGVRSFMPFLANLAAPQEAVRRHHRELIAIFQAGDPLAAGRVADDYLRLGAELAARGINKPELMPLPVPEV